MCVIWATFGRYFSIHNIQCVLLCLLPYVRPRYTVLTRYKWRSSGLPLKVLLSCLVYDPECYIFGSISCLGVVLALCYKVLGWILTIFCRLWNRCLLVELQLLLELFSRWYFRFKNPIPAVIVHSLCRTHCFLNFWNNMKHDKTEIFCLTVSFLEQTWPILSDVCELFFTFSCIQYNLEAQSFQNAFDISMSHLEMNKGIVVVFSIIMLQLRICDFWLKQAFFIEFSEILVYKLN